MHRCTTIKIYFRLEFTVASSQFKFDQNISLKNGDKGNAAIQIASSGPAFDLHQIEYGYTKMIMSAKSLSIYKALTLFQTNHTLMH